MVTTTHCTYRIQVANQKRVDVKKWDANQPMGEPFGVFSYLAYQREITTQVQLIQPSRQTNAPLFRSLGELLFNTLFDDALRQDFVNFYQKAIQNNQLLRIELDIQETSLPEVASLPWELLCLPSSANLGALWLATDPNIAFARRRAQWHVAPSIQIAVGERLKIGLIIANPTGSPELGAIATDKVQSTLEKLAQNQKERVELLPIVSSATPENIDTLLRRRPHILHFMGHGQLSYLNRKAIGKIALVDDIHKEAQWIDEGFFSELLNRHRPSIVLLQACEGGKLSSDEAFVGVASRIVQQNVPVVIAMQHSITNSSASRFAYSFYERLAQNDPVDVAVQNGRRVIALSTQYENRDFATPVLFMRVQDGYMFQQQQQASTPETATSSSSVEQNLSNSEKRSIKAGVFVENGATMIIKEQHNNFY